MPPLIGVGQFDASSLDHPAPALVRFRRMTHQELAAKVITILNLKGGVGKTHTTWLLASVCQERGKRVLLIDTDTQGNLSNSFVDDPKRGVEMLLHPGSDHDPLPLSRSTAFSHIDIISSGPSLASSTNCPITRSI